MLSAPPSFAPRAWAARLACLTCFALSIPLYAQEQDACSRALELASERYNSGFWEDVLLTLTPCLERASFSDEERPVAYEWVSKSHLGLGQREEARQALTELLLLDPFYEPDPLADQQIFIELYDETAEELRPTLEQLRAERTAQAAPPSSRRGLTRWLLIGGGVAAAGVASWLLVGRDGGNGRPEPLPAPPAIPSLN